MTIKRPRQHNEAHLKFIRSLSCLVCKAKTQTEEAAHVRQGNWHAGKRPTGLGEKPDDKWAVPLCGRHHRTQHEVGEMAFWGTHNINPVEVAAYLWAHTGQHEVGEQIVRAAHD